MCQLVVFHHVHKFGEGGLFEHAVDDSVIYHADQQQDRCGDDQGDPYAGSFRTAGLVVLTGVLGFVVHGYASFWEQNFDFSISYHNFPFPATNETKIEINFL